MIEQDQNTRSLLDTAALGPIVLDAAMGTRLINRGLLIGDDDPSLWNLSHPEIVAQIHALDLAAGARGLLTNTFGANRVWLARYDRAGHAATINRRAVEIARGAAGPQRFVLGSIGPTSAAANDLASLREQVNALADAGVDALLFETQTVEQAVWSLSVLSSTETLPRIVSLVSWPEPVLDAVRRLEDLGASALGGNCQLGIERALAMALRLGPLTHLPLWIKPAAGLPGGEHDHPSTFGAAVPALLDQGVRFLGGCCGTTDAHVAALSAVCYDSTT
ncbi:MAG: hypothetical protein NVSMB9_02570 [Isosphaeraceae bacterium]